MQGQAEVKYCFSPRALTLFQLDLIIWSFLTQINCIFIKPLAISSVWRLDMQTFTCFLTIQGYGVLLVWTSTSECLLAGFKQSAMFFIFFFHVHYNGELNVEQLFQENITDVI